MIRRTREVREQQERDLLAPAATKSTESQGREHPEKPDTYRTAFERDRDRILHTKAFRRLKHKTQVFINPEGDHYVTRLTHTLQVTQVGRAMAADLGLNEELTEAICLGHDVGHSPFGHTGEEALSPYVEGEWLHSEQSIRVLRVLEPVNLSWEVLDGIRAHSWKVGPGPATPEGHLCRFADRIAYLTHDVDDALRAGVISRRDLPTRALRVFGEPGSDWINTMIAAVVDESLRQDSVVMEPTVAETMQVLRDFMFERVYLRPASRPQQERAIAVIRNLVDHFIEHPEEVPDTYRLDDAGAVERAIDYVSGMTDRYALRVHDDLFRPEGIN
ncbi:MAG: deoxyguanosinetriphosphate triphosphohydrolase [Gammaproteobacteria bacterium]|nr:deoxyguanosinetriphosphate triphosphohydrolase [Gammaproteobacteria bacterium]